MNTMHWIGNNISMLSAPGWSKAYLFRVRIPKRLYNAISCYCQRRWGRIDWA